MTYQWELAGPSQRREDIRELWRAIGARRAAAGDMAGAKTAWIASETLRALPGSWKLPW